MAVFKRTRIALLSALVFALSGVQIAEAANSLPIESRVQRLERMLDNRVLIQLLQRIEGLQQEVRELRGQIELQNNEMAAMGKRNRDLYLDTDNRLLAIEGNKLGSLLDDDSLSESFAEVEAVIDAPEASALVDRPTVSPIDEKSVYDQAYIDLVNGRYTAASTGFRNVLTSFPEGELVHNSRYWLGETYYVERRFDEARSQFEAIVEHSPESPKIADAQLKLGLVLDEQGETDAARSALEIVLQQYPGSTASLLAQRRLDLMNAGQ